MFTIDTTVLAEPQIPAEFRNIDYANLNGIEGPTDAEDPIAWDFARFAEVG